MHFNGEVTLGSVFIIITLVGIAVSVGTRIGTLQQLVKGHTSTLIAHAQRLDSYEGRLVSIGGDMQRMIGRIEATQDRIDRKTGYRAGEGRAE